MLNLVKSFTMQVNFQLIMVSIQHLNLVSIFNVEKWHPPPPPIFNPSNTFAKLVQLPLQIVSPRDFSYFV